MAKIIVYSPVKLDAADKKSIATYMAKEHSIKADVDVKIDKSTIAGVRITYMDQEIDFSIAGKLARLANKLA